MIIYFADKTGLYSVTKNPNDNRCLACDKIEECRLITPDEEPQCMKTCLKADSESGRFHILRKVKAISE